MMNLLNIVYHLLIKFQNYPNRIGYFTKNISSNKFQELKRIKELKLTVWEQNIIYLKNYQTLN